MTALPAFEATARLGSVSAAAEELGRTHGAVSRQIRNLADDLGVALFEKDGTGLRLTERGRRFQAAVAPALDGLAAATAQLRAEASEDVVEIGVSATFAMRWLMPRMPRFYAQHPGVEVRLRMVGAQPLSDAEVDAFLTWDRLRGEPSGADVRRLGDAAFGLVAAPDYPLEREETALRAAVAFSQAGAPQIWRRWRALGGPEVIAERHVEHQHTFLSLEAAAAGLGVALVERRLVSADLATGRLTAPCGFYPAPDGFAAVMSARGRRRRSVAAFIDWLAEEAERDA